MNKWTYRNNVTVSYILCWWNTFLFSMFLNIEKIFCKNIILFLDVIYLFKHLLFIFHFCFYFLLKICYKNCRGADIIIPKSYFVVNIRYQCFLYEMFFNLVVVCQEILIIVYIYWKELLSGQKKIYYTFINIENVIVMFIEMIFNRIHLLFEFI